MQRIVPFSVCLLLAAFSTSLNSQNIFAPPVEIWEGYNFAERYYTPYFGDFDGDGHTDAAIYAESALGIPRMAIRKNNGAGLLNAQQAVLDNQPLLFQIFNWGDIDGDGRDELLEKYGYLKWTSGSNFTITNYLPGNNSATYLAHGFINNDSHIDLLIAADNNLYAAINDGVGNFTLRLVLSGFQVPPLPHFFPRHIIKDMTGDNVADIVYFPYGVADVATVFIQQTDGTFTAAPSTVRQSDMNRTMQAADFDHDGDQDIIFEKNGQFFVINNENNTFQTIDTIVSARTTGIFADFNGDGFPEFLYAGSPTMPFAVLHYNEATGNYDVAGGYEQLDTRQSYTRTVYDFDGDGDLDILATHIAQPGWRVRLTYYRNTNTFSNTNEWIEALPHSIYPLPFNNELRLNWKVDADSEIFITDLTGLPVHRQEVHFGEQAVSLPQILPAGVYFYQLKNVQGRWTQGGKIVKVK